MTFVDNLSGQDIADLRAAILGDPTLYPDAVLQWLPAYLALTQLDIPISQIQGFAQTTQAASVTRSSNQTITTGTWTTLSFDTEDYDKPDNSMHSTTTNPSRITAKVAGRYLASAFVPWNTNATGSRQVRIAQNGGAASFIASTAAVSGQATDMCITFPVFDLVINDYLEIQAFQDSGGNLDVLLSTRFCLARVN